MTLGPGARLLVVAPHVTRTGSTQVLLALLDALAPEAGSLAVDVGVGGARTAELRAWGGELRTGERPAAVLVNTGLAADRVPALAATAPVAVYVHEPREVVRAMAEPARRGLREADRVWCASAAVREAVVEVGVAEDRTTVVPPIVAAGPAPSDEDVVAARSRLSPDGAPVVLACGEAVWRKGVDLAVPLAVELGRRTAARLAWAGRRRQPIARRLDHDAASAGVAERIAWLGDVPGPSAMLAAADVVVMPSRYDPQPLVPAEAAAVGTPIAAFAVGGLADMAAADAIVAAPYPDVRLLAGLVGDLLEDPGRRAATAAAARRWVEERQAPEVVVPLVRAELAALVGSHR